MYSIFSLLLSVLATSCAIYMPFEPDHPGGRPAPTLRACLHVGGTPFSDMSSPVPLVNVSIYLLLIVSLVVYYYVVCR
jgi:hypothetical protein